MTKEILFTNGAVQNRDFSLDEKPFKAVGILSARVLNHLYGGEDTVHSWNNVGMFADLDPGCQGARLQRKYTSDFMRLHLRRWADEESVRIASDDDPDFSAWSQEVIEGSLVSGSIYCEKTEFVACRKCGMVISVAAVAVGTCSRCGSSEDLYLKEEDGLFVNLPERAGEVFRYEHLINKSNIKQELDSFKQLPGRLLLSRHRDNGVSLESFGLPDKVMDPRLGIGLLAVYQATLLGYAKAGIVQSRSTLIRTAPYLNSVITDSNGLGVSEYGYALHSKVEPALIGDVDVPPELICFHALKQKADITLEARPAILKERDALNGRIASMETLLKLSNEQIGTLGGSLVNYDQELAGGKMVSALSKINKNLGRSINYVKHGGRPSVEQQEVIDTAYASAKSLGPII